MCGICGGWSSDSSFGKDILKKMCDAIVHRGPDDVGYYDDGNFAFGMRRLSIIDLGGGHQPIHNEDETVWVVFNGEIYNFMDIRSELEKTGHKFYTDTDTEVIVHAYEEYGYECVKKFNGMFGFALYDSKKGIYFICRDRLGIKPINYYLRDGLFLFGSEIKSILQVERVSREIDPIGLYYYMGYEYVPAPRTMYKDVFRLLPGHYLVFDGKSVAIEKYWDVIDFSCPSKNLDYYTENLRRLMEESVKLRLVSDVPVGVFLSGGLDSSIIVALMSKLVDEPLKTYSVGFEEKSFNELDHARYVSDHYGTDHHEIMYRADDVRMIEDIAKYMDIPVSNTSLLPTYMVSKLARKTVTVTLGGDGSDELFGGYDRYIANGIDRYYRMVPKVCRRALTGAVDKVPVRGRRKGLVNSVKAFVGAAALEQSTRHVRWQMVPNVCEDRSIYSPEFVGSMGEFDPFSPIKGYFESANANNELAACQYVDIKSYLPDNILCKNDFVTMASSIELRVPFLDHNVVEFVARVPQRFRIHGFTKKYVLRKAFGNILPERIVRRKKQGFMVPVNKWMGGEISEYMGVLFDDAQICKNNIINDSYIRSTIERHNVGNSDCSSRLWALMNLELWYRNYMVD